LISAKDVIMEFGKKNGHHSMKNGNKVYTSQTS